MDMAITQLNVALEEVYAWCLNNQLTTHPPNEKAIMLSEGNL